MKKILFFLAILNFFQLGCSGSWPHYDEYWNNLYKRFAIPTEEFHNQNYEGAKVLLWKYVEIDTAIANYEAYAFLSQTYFQLGYMDSGKIVLQDAITRVKAKIKDKPKNSGDFSSTIDDLNTWLDIYPTFPEYLKKENGFVPYDNWPVPVNGLTDLAMRLKYPNKALKNETEGKVVIKAYIDKKGEVYAADVYKALTPECDAEAISVVLDTQFTICRRKGKAENTIVFIPIVFRLRH